MNCIIKRIKLFVYVNYAKSTYSCPPINTECIFVIKWKHRFVC